MFAVSYTHLDVYKRQTRNHGAPRSDLADQADAGAGIGDVVRLRHPPRRARLRRRAGPVSYTHLDVYKRQSGARMAGPIHV